MIRVIDLKTMSEATPPPFSVLCLGNFDGVHIGHRTLAERTVRIKEELSASLAGLGSGAWLFETPPSLSLCPKPIPQLSTLEEKLVRFAEIGLDYAFLADFSALKDLSPEEFVGKVLKEQCHCVYAICGFDFRFAKDASGNADTLMSLMDGRGETVGCVALDGETVSSSAIRALLMDGNAEKATRMLGAPFSLSAEVLHGKALGKNLGVPTINQHFATGAIRPKDGVYISRTRIGDTLYPSVSNIGTRPTFADGETVNCETHILGYEGDLYGQTIRVEFLKRLREEIRFSSVDELGQQLRADIAEAARYFEHTRRQI